MSATDSKSTANSSGRPAARVRGPYRTLDIVTVATLGVAFGAVFWGWSQLYTLLSNLAVFSFPPSSGLLAGPWLLAGVVGGLLIRRPGAALTTEFLAANVSMLLGSQWGTGVLVSGLIQGLGAEVVLALLLYRRFGLTAAVLAGAVSAAAGAVYEWYAYYPDWDFGYRLAYLGFFATSGALLAGVGGFLLVRALARTGAVDAFPAGREHALRSSV